MRSVNNNVVYDKYTYNVQYTSKPVTQKKKQRAEPESLSIYYNIIQPKIVKWKMRFKFRNEKPTWHIHFRITTIAMNAILYILSPIRQLLTLSKYILIRSVHFDDYYYFVLFLDVCKTSVDDCSVCVWLCLYVFYECHSSFCNGFQFSFSISHRDAAQ